MRERSSERAAAGGREASLGTVVGRWRSECLYLRKAVVYNPWAILDFIDEERLRVLVGYRAFNSEDDLI
jgi:hypothetical protein